MHLLGLSSERNTAPLKKGSSATLNTHSATTELGRDRDMRRDVPVDALRAPQPKAREKLSAAGEQQARKKMHLLHKQP